MLHSFENTARELNCTVGLLRQAVEDRNFRSVVVPSLTDAAYAAVVANEVIVVMTKNEDGSPMWAKRIIARKKKWKRAVAVLDEFPGYYPAQLIANEGGLRSDQLEDLVRDLGHPVVRVPALTEESHRRALLELRHLADETPPPGVIGPGAAQWDRDRRRRQREVAEAGG